MVSSWFVLCVGLVDALACVSISHLLHFRLLKHSRRFCTFIELDSVSFGAEMDSKSQTNVSSRLAVQKYDVELRLSPNFIAGRNQ